MIAHDTLTSAVAVDQCIVCGGVEMAKPLYPGILKCGACGYIYADMRLTDEQLFTLYNEAFFSGAEFSDCMILDDYLVMVGMPTGGAVRVSLGLVTNFADVYRFMRFASEFRDVGETPVGLPPRLAC